MNDNYAAGLGRNFNTSFAHTAGGNDAYLYNYSTFGGGFYAYASNIVNGSTIVPAGRLFRLLLAQPGGVELWSLGGGKPITMLQGGQPAEHAHLPAQRWAGRRSQLQSVCGVPGAVPGSYSYPFTIPRVTDGTDLTFTARADGSAENILFELDGGVDLNGARSA